MKQFSYVLTRPYIAKQVSSLTKVVSRFSSSVCLRHNDKDVSISNARTPMHIDSGSRITITVDGRDEEAAVAAIQNYFVVNM